MTFDGSASTDSLGVLIGLESVLRGVFLPCLKQLESGWGSLDPTVDVATAVVADPNRVRAAFLARLDNFLQLLDSMSAHSTL